MNLVTLGVYGFDDESWFRALQEARVDTFIDVRQRRGVRGAQYAFVNSQRLQQQLGVRGIRYLHIKQLAPTGEMRAAQAIIDKQERIAKRQRTDLSIEFEKAYQRAILDVFDIASFLAALPEDAATVALFCVERDPGACHRSLVAEFLQRRLGWTVTHLLPEQDSAESA